MTQPSGDGRQLPLSARMRSPLGGMASAIAVATVLLGIADIATVLLPQHAARLQPVTSVVPLGIAHDASAAVAVAGILLVLLGKGLRRRKRRAWRAAVGLTVATAALHLVRGVDLVPATVSILLAVVLIAASSTFYAAGDPRTRWRAPAVFLGLVVASLVLGQLLLLARSGSLVGHPPLSQRWQEITEGLVGVAGPLRFAGDGSSDLVASVLGALGLVTVLLPAYLALRPAEPPAQLSDDDALRLRALLGKYADRDSLGYFALRDDKAVIFSASGKAAVSYRVLTGVMLASGDPIGDPEAWPGAIARFVEEARRHAWVPAVMGCSEQGGEIWVRGTGLRALELGDEAIVTVSDFSLEGRAMRNVRQMVARTQRAGYVTQVRRVGDLSAEEKEQIRSQAAAWRETETERGFSMALGRFGDPEDGDCVVVTATREDRLAAVLHFVPWGEAGLSLDLMRRDRSADPGLNEAMIVAALGAATELGVDRLSLNFSVFRSALERGGRLGAGPVLRLWRALLLWASRWFQIESLYRFNAKFRPVWEPRFVCYPGASDLPRIAIAALEAEAFIVWPRLGRPSRRARHARRDATLDDHGREPAGVM